MAQILAFRPQTRPSRPARRTAAGSIVIFPGVRVVYHTEAAEAPLQAAVAE